MVGRHAPPLNGDGVVCERANQAGDQPLHELGSRGVVVPCERSCILFSGGIGALRTQLLHLDVDSQLHQSIPVDRKKSASE
jgi:hypothetical protein